MKKRLLVGISMVMLAIVMFSMTSFATENSTKDDDLYLYFVDGVQVDAAEYPYHEQVFSETSEQYEALAVLENNWDYYIVNANGIKKVAEEEYDSAVGTHSELSSRFMGSWYIKDNVMNPGYTIYYYQTNGNQFVVASDEYIELKIDIANHARSFGVGYDGTSFQKEYINLLKNKGAIIAFIDDIEVPGSYRVFIENSGDFTEIVNGNIAVKKR